MTAPTLVLVHGAGCDHHAWDELRSALGGTAVLALDLPGRGDGRPPCTSAFEAAAAVLAGMTAHGVAPSEAVVMGHSYGGAISMECALAAPFAGLVLAATGARLRVHPLVISAMRANAAAGATSGASIGWRPGVSRELVARFDAAAMRVPASTTLTDWLAADVFDRMADVATLTLPTLVIGGTADELTPPKYARYLATAIPGAALALLEDAGHMCVIEDAARVAARVRDFTTSLAARR